MLFFQPKPVLKPFSFSLCLLLVSWQSQAAPMDNAADALTQAQKHLEHKLARISSYHEAARSSMKESLQLPLFEAYFNLPESRNYHHDNLGRIQLTDKQNQIRAQMEDWILSLHSRFPIGETCLIDDHGQEHLRVVGGEIKPPHMFSGDEHGAPFFNPTFKLKDGEVFMSEPYFSEDSFYWVTSFTSPIYLQDGSVPGFYHFEIPLIVYSDLISFKDFSFTHFKGNVLDIDEEGRNFIINENNLVIADSESKIDFNLPDERNPDINMDLPDYLPPEKIENYIKDLSSILPKKDSEKIAQQMRQKKQGTLFVNIRGREYVLAFAPVPNRPNWILTHLDPIGGPAYWDMNIAKP